MPIWPVCQLTGWVVDPHYLVRLQTFCQRAAEVSLVWREDTSSVREVVLRLHEGDLTYIMTISASNHIQ